MAYARVAFTHLAWARVTSTRVLCARVLCAVDVTKRNQMRKLTMSTMWHGNKIHKLDTRLETFFYLLYFLLELFFL